MVSLISMPEKNGILKYSVIYATVAACVGYSTQRRKINLTQAGNQGRLYKMGKLGSLS